MRDIRNYVEQALAQLRSAMISVASAQAQLAIAHIDSFDYKLSGVMSELSDVHLDLHATVLGPDGADQPELA